MRAITVACRREMAFAELWGSPRELEYWIPPQIIEPTITRPTPSDRTRTIANSMSIIGLPLAWQPRSMVVLTVGWPAPPPQVVPAKTLIGAANVTTSRSKTLMSVMRSGRLRLCFMLYFAYNGHYGISHFIKQRLGWLRCRRELAK